MASQDWVEKDFYATLGVSKDASADDIKKAYRKLSRKYHPDMNASDEASEKKFKEVSEANSVLSDPEQRKQYDAIRAMGSGARFTAGGPGGGAGGFEDVFSGLFNGGAFQGGRGFNPGAYGGGNFGGQNINFEDLFNSAGAGFGGFPGGGSAQPAKGADRTASTTIGFGSSLKGTKIGLREPSGETIEVRIPAGIKDGQKVRVKGKGQQGAGGAGDLLVTVNVRPHPVFERDGDDIRVTVPVSFAEAALGGVITVPTITGQPVTLRVPAGSSSGKVMRVKGRGVERKGVAGDMYVTLQVAVPSELSDDARAAVEQYAAATEGENPRAALEQDAAL